MEFYLLRAPYDLFVRDHYLGPQLYDGFFGDVLSIGDHAHTDGSSHKEAYLDCRKLLSQF